MLTKRENEILACNAVGMSVKEIADHICRSEFTVQKTISNVKAKTGLQKNTELAANFWIERYGNGDNFLEVKNRILSSVMLLCLILSMTSSNIGDMELPYRREKYEKPTIALRWIRNI